MINELTRGKDFNKTQPELREGEILLTNDTEEEFRKIPRRTKRIGKIAYDIDGKQIERGVSILPAIYPVFVQRKELEDDGILPKSS